MDSVARVATDRGGRYGKQLCQHFSRKVPATWDDNRGEATFPGGSCTFLVEPDALVIRATAADETGLSQVEQVVGSHLERFSQRDALSVHWQRVAADAS